MNSNDTTTKRGNHAENQAADFLEQRGLTVIARNYRCRGGEIDLICREGRTLIFVEVRLRTSDAFGGAAASITPAKQRRVVGAAKHYLATHGSMGRDCRIDCVLLDGKRIEWLKNAITAD